MDEGLENNGNLTFLNDSIPCGFIKYTCEKQPRITYMNQNMKDIFCFPGHRQEGEDYLEMCRDNIFLMIPVEERHRFSKYLDRVYASESPIAGEMALLRCDGSRAYVFGWVTRCTLPDGREEFQSVCMDVTEKHKEKKQKETKQYLNALSDVYDKVFEFNLESNTVKCLHSEETSMFNPFRDIAMQIDDALNKWIFDSVEAEEAKKVRSFFTEYCEHKHHESGEKPQQISYQARSSSGEVKRYRGIFIRVDETISLFCCRRVLPEADVQILKRENNQLKEQMKEIVKNFSDGLAAFEITAEGLVKPLYSSENVWKFFGYSEDEWNRLTEEYTPLENFVAYSEIVYDRFAELLKKGEAEFSYFDHVSRSKQRVKAICSRREPAGETSRFVMLYSMNKKGSGKKTQLQEKRQVTIRTFGFFDVFVGDVPISFRNRKSKELLAILVDRRGGFVSSGEAISYLWEDEPVNAVTLSRYRKVALRLKNTLEEYSIPDIVEAVDGKRRIVMENVDCDLYDYLSGEEKYRTLFKGSYLSNYSWGETTLGELEMNSYNN